MGTCLLLGACGGGHHPAARTDTTCDGNIRGKQSIVAWFHIGSLDPEGVELKKQTDEFNASQNQVHVRVVFIPNATYTSTVQNAAASGALVCPCGRRNSCPAPARLTPIVETRPW